MTNDNIETLLETMPTMSDDERHLLSVQSKRHIKQTIAEIKMQEVLMEPDKFVKALPYNTMNIKIFEEACELIAHGHSLSKTANTLNFRIKDFYSLMRRQQSEQITSSTSQQSTKRPNEQEEAGSSANLLPPVNLMELYQQAKIDQADALAERILDVTDEVREDRLDHQKGKIAIDAYKWVASKMKPDKYSDRIDQHISGSIDLIPAIEKGRQRLISLRKLQDEGGIIENES